MKKQDFKVLKTKDLYPFPDNPFHVAEDETLSELAESIKEFGIVTPIITRPKEVGPNGRSKFITYEMEVSIPHSNHTQVSPEGDIWKVTIRHRKNPEEAM